MNLDIRSAMAALSWLRDSPRALAGVLGGLCLCLAAWLLLETAALAQQEDVIAHRIGGYIEDTKQNVTFAKTLLSSHLEVSASRESYENLHHARM